MQRWCIGEGYGKGGAAGKELKEKLWNESDEGKMEKESKGVGAHTVREGVKDQLGHELGGT